jgi:PAP2 superfamily protein
MKSRASFSDFAPEWLALAAIAAADAAWARLIGFHLLVTARDLMVVGGAGALAVLARLLKQKRAALMTEYFCLSLAGTIVFCVMSYLAMASTDGRLWDARFLAADRALGFDWLTLYRWIAAHSGLANVLQLFYASVIAQGLIACVWLGARGQVGDMRGLFRLIFLGSLITCIGAVFFPALGPYKLFAIAGRGAFLADMQHLLSGRDLTFALSQMTGVVSFPSFHTVLALAYGWSFRRAGAFGAAMVAINVAMLFAIPFFGGHYLVDVLAGAGVFAAALLIVKTLERISAGCASPESAAACAGAYSGALPSR